MELNHERIHTAGIERAQERSVESPEVLRLLALRQTFRLNGPEMIPANDRMTQALILSQTDYSSLLGNEGNLNFYANSVSLMGHAFLSPLASSGTLYYRYYLEGDTIHFRTRNAFYATFNGTMVIDTATFALRSIHAYVPAEVAVNYVNTLHVMQVLAEDGTITEEQVSAVLDFAIKSETAGTVFPTLLLTTRLSNTREPMNPKEPGELSYAEQTTDSAFNTCRTLVHTHCQGISIRIVHSQNE